MLDKNNYLWIDRPRTKYELDVARQNYQEFLSFANLVDNQESFNNYCDIYGFNADYNTRWLLMNNKHSDILDFHTWLKNASLTDTYLQELEAEKDYNIRIQIETKYEKLYNDYIANFYN